MTGRNYPRVDFKRKLTTLRAGQPSKSGSIPERQERILSFSKRQDRHWGPYILLFNLRPRVFPRVKRPTHASYHSLAPTADAKNGWNYTSTPFHAYRSCTVTILTLRYRLNRALGGHNTLCRILREERSLVDHPGIKPRFLGSSSPQTISIPSKFLRNL